MLTSSIPGSFSDDTSQSCSWTFIQKSFPGKYKLKSETDLQVSTVSTCRHTLTNIRFDVSVYFVDSCLGIKVLRQMRMLKLCS